MKAEFKIEVLYEDNHIVAVNKKVSDIVQGDITGDKPLAEFVKDFIKEKYNKPGKVFLGVTHRLDRPTSGVLIFARTSKALSRLNEMFKQKKDLTKVYWAIVKNKPKEQKAELRNYLIKDAKRNKSFVCTKEKAGAKEAILKYKHVNSSDNYHLLEIELLTGRHHQIRAQLANMGCPIKGDLKYGFNRSNIDGGISLHARKLSFKHPVSRKNIEIEAPVPNDKVWQYFQSQMAK